MLLVYQILIQKKTNSASNHACEAVVMVIRFFSQSPLEAESETC